MKLFHIDGGKCKHIIELMPSIKAVYQMEQEFFPYLDVIFLPYREGEKSGIILQTKSDIIRKDYTFHNKEDLENLRNLIWFYLQKENNIKDITVKGCLTNFRETNPNKVIQGWHMRKKYAERDSDYIDGCKIINDTLTSELVKYGILHEVYKLNTHKVMNKDSCKQTRYKECSDNFPPNTYSFVRCIDEVDWICNNGYPNKVLEDTNQIVNGIRKRLIDVLIKNNFKVNKKRFDDIIDAGLFADLGNRMGNKVISDKNVSAVIDRVFTENDYYRQLIEGFETNDNSYMFYLVLFVILIVFIAVIFKKVD